MLTRQTVGILCNMTVLQLFDINPIGGLNKNDLRDFLRYAAETFGYNTFA